MVQCPPSIKLALSTQDGLSKHGRICHSDMWFITLVKMKKAPNAQEAAAMNKTMQEAATKLGVKIHHGFVTLGRYDAVWISEAPDISGPMRLSMRGPDVEWSETLVATSYEDAMNWSK